jgi:hypothetical protein
MSTTTKQAKELFCDAFNQVYGNDITISSTDDSLFYKVEKGPEKYPDFYKVLLNREHDAYKYCLCMKAGIHTRSTKSRSYTVNIRTAAVGQKCWARQCEDRENKGKCMLHEGDWQSEDELESEDDDSEACFFASSNKKRKR